MDSSRGFKKKKQKTPSGFPYGRVELLETGARFPVCPSVDLAPGCVEATWRSLLLPELSDRRQQLGKKLAPSPRERGLKRLVFWVGGCFDARELEGRKPNVVSEREGGDGDVERSGRMTERDGADYEKNGEEEDGMKVNFKEGEEDCRGAQVNPEVGQKPLDY